MAVRAILFDVGGPIDLEFAWEIAVEGAMASACGIEGIRVDQAPIDAASERAVEAFVPDTYLHMVETLTGGDPAASRRVRHRMRAMLESVDVFQLRPGIETLLPRLAAKGFRLGVVANQPTRMRRQLERAGIAAFFGHLGLSGEDGLRKPDPRAFMRVADALALPPAQCLMVGDRIDNDIAPARALGMATILFRTGHHRRQKPRSAADAPHAIVTDVLELERAIAGLTA